MEKLPSLCVFLALLVHCLTLSFVDAGVTKISTDKQALLSPENLCGFRHHRVTALNISHLGLTGTLPPQLENLSFLATIDIKNNSFYGSLPEELLAQLRRLKYLSFSYNILSVELPPSIFDNLPNLQSVYLHENMLQGKIPSTLSKCQILQYLYLSFNYFTGLIPKEIGNLTQLKRVYLGDNKLQGEISKELGNLAEVEILSLSNNSLTGTIPTLLFNLSSLIYMDFSNNSLIGSLPDNMCQYLPNLEGGIPYEIGNLRNLEILQLEFNSLVGPVLACLQHLNNDNTFSFGK
ncbi:hypothetical protein Patl1_11963 [Pistacia atlantica]|uniref:Uncharacterized protein n=1 Tax=Pistacia atlantica TaxID=434234 RepID=A0ACC1A8X8_9ROSI|nr:hypothetical protein Patl1_11963 [Pistacia atlantica]